MDRRAFLVALTSALSLAAACRHAPRSALPAAPPNILLLTIDDMGYDALGVAGNPLPGLTPNMDALAGEGLRFDRAHVTVSLCQPSRSVMMTGRYPHRSGAEGFDPIRQGIPNLPAALGRAGWLTGIHGKVNHLKPIKAFAWAERVGGVDLGEGRDPAAYGAAAAAFFAKAGALGRPFFLMSNLHDPHRPFATSADEAKWPAHNNYPSPPRVYDPAEVPVPPSLPDLPAVREELAQYYASVSRADAGVGAILAALDASGLADSTLVALLSDNGFAFPFAKATCYLAGTRTPLLLRWPGVILPGQVEAEHLVTSLDLAPTLLEIAGLPPLSGADGRSFLPLLQGRDLPGFERAFTVFHETFDREAYPTRCVQGADVGYIYNAWSRPGARFDVEAEKGLTRAAMEAEGLLNPAMAARVRFWEERTPEELYDLAADPGCLNNLAQDPAWGDALRERRRDLRAWMVQVQDPLLPDYSRHLEGVGG